MNPQDPHIPHVPHDPAVEFPVGNFINPIILDPNSITKYVEKLLPPTILKPTNEKYFGNKKKQFYWIEMKEVVHKFHPSIPPTKIWIYSSPYHKKPHGQKQFVDNAAPLLIRTEKYNSVIVKWVNNLPFRHLLEEYIDHTLHGAGEETPDVRNVVHLHGGTQAPTSDGDPTDWYTPNQYKISTYPSLEPPCMLFWHDHAVGITRLNVYAGLSGGIYIINDANIEKNLNLPRGKYEVPLVITDKMFDIHGQLVYSTSNSSPAHPKWKSTFLGNMISVNNLVWPYLEVDQNKYRFRIVNSSDTRTYSFKLVYADDFTKAGPPFYQIGTDAGYLPKPILLNEPNNPNSPQLRLAIAERADIIIDFSGYPQGTEFIMLNTANAPFPNGNPPDINNVGQVMKFIVSRIPSCKQNICQPNFCIATPNNFRRINPTKASVVRKLILDINHMGTTHPEALYLNNLDFMKPVTERPLVGATEIWEIINITNGMHPIHIHLIDFQLLNRQKINSVGYIEAIMNANPVLVPGEGIPNVPDLTPYLLGEPISPFGTSDDGWKDVIQANGNEVTRLIMTFAPTDGPKKYPFDPTLGSYVWHCHILSHEDSDMMRPLQLYWGNKSQKHNKLIMNDPH